MTAGLADDQFQTTSYITFQKADSASEQDKHLGMEGIYCEVNDQLYSSYGGVRSIELFQDRLDVCLDEKAAESMKLPGHFSIGLSLNHPDLDTFVDTVSKTEPGIVQGKK